MREFCEGLETRTLFSGGIQTVTLDYDAVVADAAAIKADYTAEALNLKGEAKLIAANIKTLGKSKTNSTDVAALNKAIATAEAPELKVTNQLISAGKTALNRAKSAFAAEVSRPTNARATKLASALETLTSVLGPYESKLESDFSASDTKITAALGVITAANPTDTTLAADASTAESYASGSLSTLSSVLATTNTDIDTLAADVS
jgi:hypothetical protein